MKYPEVLQRVTVPSWLWMPHRGSKPRHLPMYIWHWIMIWMCFRSSIRLICQVHVRNEVAQEIEDVIGIEAMDAPRISAKTGLNIDEVLEQIVTKIPAPAGDPKMHRLRR